MVIEQYQDPRVSKYLRYGFWYQEHKAQVQRAIRLGLGVLAAAFWLAALYQGYLFYLSSRQYDNLLRSLAVERIPILDLHQRQAPLPFVIAEAVVVPGGASQTADFLVRLENPNPNWYFELGYSFSWDNGQSLPQTTVVMPGAKTVLTTRGVTVNSLPASAVFNFTVQNARRTKDQELLARAQTIMAGLSITAAETSRENGITRAAYTVGNSTIYDLIAPRFLVLLLQFQDIVALGLNEVPQLGAGEERDLELRFLQELPPGLWLEVVPIFNVFAPDAYRLPAGGAVQF